MRLKQLRSYVLWLPPQLSTSLLLCVCHQRHITPLNISRMISTCLQNHTGSGKYLPNKKHSDNDDSGSQLEAWDILS